METKTIYANNYLFKIGEPDDSIYVVESGRVHVYITDEVITFYLVSLFQKTYLYTQSILNFIGIDLIYYIKFKNLNSLFTFYRKAVNI